jgi:hypothetical protein
MTDQPVWKNLIARARRMGIISTGELKDLGIPRVYLTRLVRDGKLERVSRGLYRLPDSEISSHQTNDTGGQKKVRNSGYQPVCRDEWVRPVCSKPKIKCGDCENRDFVPIWPLSTGSRRCFPQVLTKTLTRWPNQKNRRKPQKEKARCILLIQRAF